MPVTFSKTQEKSKVMPAPPELKRLLLKTGRNKQLASSNVTEDTVRSIAEDAGVPMREDLQLDGPPKPGQKRFRPTKEAVDYRRKQILRLVLRGVPKQTIAEHLGLTLRTVYDDLGEINQEMRQELQSLDYVSFIGMTNAFFDECRNIALRLATDSSKENGKPKVSVGNQMAALRTAMEAETRRADFLARVGLFKTVSPTDPFNQIQTGRHGSYTDENDLNSLVQLIAQAAAGETVDVQARVVDGQ